MVQSHSSQRVEIHIPTDEVQCKNREEVIIRPSLASHESAMVGFQIRHPRKDRDQSSRMEEFVTAISNANLMRIRPKPIIVREDDSGFQSDLNHSDGEQEYNEANPSASTHS